MNEVRLATTEEARMIARQAFVQVTGSCYDYKMAWTDKDLSSVGKYFRRIGMLAPIGKGERIVEVMNEMLEKEKLCVMHLRATPSGYVRFKAIFQPAVDKVFQN
jgi:hypothetical protein